MILTAPFASFTHFAPHHYATGFNRYFYEKHLPEFGFEIVEVTANGNFFEYAAQEIRRIPEMSKSYAGTKVGRLERWAIKLLLRFLQRCTNQDGGSNQFAAFGYHIRAVRRADL